MSRCPNCNHDLSKTPTANPAASAKGQDTRFASDFLELDRAIAELNRRITKLEARQ